MLARRPLLALAECRKAIGIQRPKHATCTLSGLYSFHSWQQCVVGASAARQASGIGSGCGCMAFATIAPAARSLFMTRTPFMA